jgi:hypothetical protein
MQMHSTSTELSSVVPTRPVLQVNYIFVLFETAELQMLTCTLTNFMHSSFMVLLQ